MIASNFKDAALEAQFNEDGYAIVPAFFTAEEVSDMLALYRSLHQQKHHPNSGQWNSLIDIESTLSKEVSEKILKVLKPKLETLLDNTVTPVATLLVKYAGDNTFCYMHRDFSILDESRFEYRNIWIPLVDITEQNGALFVLPKSHKIFGEELPMTQPWMYEPNAPALMKYVKAAYPKAGDMIVYKDKMVHGSFQNFTEDTRPVIHLGTLPQEAQTCFYYLNGNEVEVYEVSPDYFFRNDLGQPPSDRKPIRTYPYKFKEYSDKDVEALFG